MSYVAVVPYADSTYATAYFADRLGTTTWDTTSSGDKSKSLAMATRAIDQLNFAGHKAVDTQLRQFPRGDDTAIPDAIMRATCEIALSLLDGADPTADVNDLGLTKKAIGSAVNEWDSTFVQDFVAAGIPSLVAWSLLTPFLRDPRQVSVDRS